MTIVRAVAVLGLIAAFAACANVPPPPPTPHPFGGTSPSPVPGARSNGR